MTRVLTLPETPSAALSIRAKALVFHDPLSQRLLHQVERVAHSDATVLINGETGTGKELIARHIHQVSGRSGPFVAVNCGAFSESLIDAELFGHEAGAFTGASQARAGWFEAANGGTLFLDEIGDLPMALQVKLLRVLQERQVVRLGSRKSVTLDVRLVAATNIDLARAVEAQHFRADLYYRLSVAAVQLPPLRERPADILPLVDHFIQHFRGRLQLEDVRLTEVAKETLLRYSWPGNIRELENVIHYALIVCRDGVVRADDLRLVPLHGQHRQDRDGLVAGGLGVRRETVSEPAEPISESATLGDDSPAQSLAAADNQPVPQEPVSEGHALDRLASVFRALLSEGHPALFDAVESTLVHVTFEHAQGNQVRSARELGITRNVLRTLLKRHGLLDREDLEGHAQPADKPAVLA